jgi:hypothetical protein
MNWDDFQQRAIVAIPKQTLKRNRCWVGVLRHEKPPEAPLEERDFLWMIGYDVCITDVCSLILHKKLLEPTPIDICVADAHPDDPRNIFEITQCNQPPAQTQRRSRRPERHSPVLPAAWQ